MPGHICMYLLHGYRHNTLHMHGRVHTLRVACTYFIDCCNHYWIIMNVVPKQIQFLNYVLLK